MRDLEEDKVLLKVSSNPSQIIEIAEYWISQCEKQQSEIERLKAENDKMRECLEWYGDELNYRQPKPFYKPQAEVDRGEYARECLSNLGGSADAT